MKKDKSLKHFIIFINSYNDFDNILPFIDYVLLNKKAKVTLYKTNDSDLNGCKDHLYYLEHAYNLIPSYYDENFSKYYNFSVILYRKYRNFARRAKHSSMLIPTLFILPWFKTFISFFTKIQVTKNKKNLTADIILFDFGKELGFYGSNIVNLLKKNSVSVVGYLHGFSIYTNLNPLTKDTATPNQFKKILIKLSKPKVERVYCDRYVVGNGQRDTYFSTSMMSSYEAKFLDRVCEVGIPRFTSEWIDKYRNNVVEFSNFSYGEKNKINVVLFMSHSQYNVHTDKLIQTIKKLSLCNKINLVYKPHTRSGLKKVNFKDINAYNAKDVSSLELSHWADVGIAYGTSIAFQLLQDNVPLIMPRYLHSNTTIFEENDVCIVADSLSELLNFFDYKINNIVEQKNIDKFLEFYIYGGCDYNGLMENFFNSSVKNCA